MSLFHPELVQKSEIQSKNRRKWRGENRAKLAIFKEKIFHENDTLVTADFNSKILQAMGFRMVPR